MTTSISFEKKILPNGLHVITHVDKSIPVAAVNLWYHVGSKNEEPGKTGFAHLFEHIMFEGSKNHNKDYFEPLQKVGANINGSTSNDATNYWEDIPSNSLELALWLESDRMGFLLDALDQNRFDLQREVVKNERRQSYENRPYGMAYLLLQEALFPSPHPYNWPVIGSQKDLNDANLEDVKEFFKRYYHPNNASLSIAGDINPEEVFKLTEKYFGDLQPGEPVDRLLSSSSNLNGDTKIEIEDSVQLPRLYLAWPTVPDLTESQAELDILSIILAGGRSSRLEKKLVIDSQIAYDINAYHHGQEICGEFHIIATGKPNESLDKIKQEILNEITNIISSPPSQHEMERSINNIEAMHIRQLEKVGGFGGKADQLNYYNVMKGDPGFINLDIERYKKITPDQISNAAKLLNENRVSLSVLPKQNLTISSPISDRTKMPVTQKRMEFAPPSPQRIKLNNNVDIVLIEKPDLPLVSIGLLTNLGASSDPIKNPGLAKFATEMFSEGTSKRTSEKISEEIEHLAFRFKEDVSRNHIFFSINGLKNNLDSGMKLFADITQNPIFPEQETERLRSEILADITSSQDNANKVAGTAARAILYGGVNTEYGHPIIGSTKSIKNIQQKDLIEFNQNIFHKSKATFIAVGDIKSPELLHHIESNFSTDFFNHSDPISPPVFPTNQFKNSVGGIYVIDRPGSAQSVIRAGHLTIPRDHQDYFSLAFGNYVLGGEYSSRVNMNLRQDKGYSYGFYSSIDWGQHSSTWLIRGSVQTEVTFESVKEILFEINGINGSKPISSKEFEDSKQGLLKGIPSQFESSNQMLNQLIKLVQFNLPDNDFSESIKKIEALTLDEVNLSSKNHFKPDESVIVIVGDKEKFIGQLETLKLPIHIVDMYGE
tara:strand:+ start:2437 stop:5094 length:2658 start_codon:yes stop_codon:yes gene_type:complete